MKPTRAVAIVALISAAIVYASTFLGPQWPGDPNWFSVADIYSLSHESLFLAFFAIGMIALYLDWRGH